jgi:Flp pilus assembly protein TadG
VSRQRALAEDSSGATLVEFALIAPVLLIALLGVFDMTYNIYLQGLLQGSIQKAARDSTIEGAAGKDAVIDAIVTEAVHDIVPGAEIAFDRSAYSNFGDISQPEDFTDTDGDGNCNNGEPFEDANGNGIWDTDRGTTGFGGARDAVLYTVDVSYPRAFPVGRLVGMGDTFTTRATTVLRNQPYGEQQVRASVEYCP